MVAALTVAASRTEEVGWDALLAHPEVTEVVELGSPVGFLAYHAGLEAGTGEIAAAAARASGASLYAVIQPARLRWHVASTAIDPARSAALTSFLSTVEVAIALHGYGRLGPSDAILLGGTHRPLATAVAAGLRRRLPGLAVIDDLGEIPARLRGIHPANPVNRPAGGGVQIELPVAVRAHHRELVADILAGVASEAAHPGATRWIRRRDPPPG